MDLTPRGIFEELNRLPWGRFTDKQRKAAITKFAGAIYAEMRKAGVGAPGVQMTDAERREELVSFFDEKLRARELTAAEVREMVSLCGLDKRTQDMTIDIVDFRDVDWNAERGEIDAQTGEEDEEDTSPTA